MSVGWCAPSISIRRIHNLLHRNCILPDRISSMNTVRNDLFGKVAFPGSLQELLGIVLSKEECRARIWRGQADLSWPLHSTAYRRLSRDGKEVSDAKVCRYEERLLREATHRGYRLLEGRELSDLELLARLRHHGAATRLVDATRSVLVALWFSVSERMGTTGALIGLHTDYLGGHEGKPEVRRYDEIVSMLASLDYSVTWEPTAVTPRVAAQHSQFLYSSVSAQRSGSLRTAEKKDALLVLAIEPELKKSVKLALERAFDIRDLTLFPDVGGFCAANNQEVGQFDVYRW